VPPVARLLSAAGLAPAGGRCRRRGRPVRTRTAAHRAIGKRAGVCAFSTSSTRHHHHRSMNTGSCDCSGPATGSATGSPGPSPVPPPLRRRFTESPVLCPRNFRPESARPNAAKPTRLTHEACVTGQAREGATPSKAVTERLRRSADRGLPGVAPSLALSFGVMRRNDINASTACSAETRDANGGASQSPDLPSGSVSLRRGQSLLRSGNKDVHSASRSTCGRVRRQHSLLYTSTCCPSAGGFLDLREPGGLGLGRPLAHGSISSGPGARSPVAIRTS